MTLQSVSVEGVKKYIFGKGLSSHKIKEISELMHGFKKKSVHYLNQIYRELNYELPKEENYYN
jgi:hypothetical protein